MTGDEQGAVNPVDVVTRESGPPALRPFLTEIGCSVRDSAPANGSIGIFTTGGVIQRFDCKGIQGPAIREGLARYHERLNAEARFASSMEGYAIRHYLGSQEFCNNEVTSWWFGNDYMGSETVWDYGSCITVAFFWDEWIPGYGNTEIPEPYPGGGGPFYGPDQPVNKVPRLDTTLVDHSCDGVDSTKRLRNRTCLHPISEKPIDSLRIWDSLWTHLRPLNQISNPTFRAHCDSLRTWFSQALAWHSNNYELYGLINRGATDSIPLGGQQHNAQSNGLGTPSIPQPFHVDPRVLDSANTAAGKRQLLESVMHEVGHAFKGIDHPQNAAATNYSGVPYFEALESHSCTVI